MCDVRLHCLLIGAVYEQLHSDECSIHTEFRATGPPQYKGKLSSTSISVSTRISCRSCPVGLFKHRPNVPTLSVCVSISTARSKRGSGIAGGAINKLPSCGFFKVNSSQE
jgi:hypothetical protein